MTMSQKSLHVYLCVWMCRTNSFSAPFLQDEAWGNNFWSSCLLTPFRFEFHNYVEILEHRLNGSGSKWGPWKIYLENRENSVKENKRTFSSGGKVWGEVEWVYNQWIFEIYLISMKTFKYNVNIYNSPWTLRLKLIKMLQGFMWDLGHFVWGGYFIFYLEWVYIEPLPSKIVVCSSTPST